MSVNYFHIMKFLAKGNKWQFDIPKQTQSDFIDSLGEPEGDLSRSFKQYKSQMLFIGTAKRLIFNAASLVATPLFLIAAFLRRLTTQRKNHIDAIIERNTHSGVIPPSLQKKYPMLDSTPWADGWSLGLSDLGFVCRMLPYMVRSPYFVFKNLYKAALYSKMIKSHSPEAIVVFNEYSFTSSALTHLCESHDIAHIDVMHGEKLFFIYDSFFRFTHTYVWEPYYKELFVRMKASPDQFIAELPPFMSIPELPTDDSIFADYKYYLATYNEEQLKSIINSMSFVKAAGAKVKYRPHPRYSDIELLKKYVDEKDIEYPGQVDIIDSVANLAYAVGSYTTVLNQAFHAGKKVILDDVTFIDNFNKLKELEFVLMYKPTLRLSSFQ